MKRIAWTLAVVGMLLGCRSEHSNVKPDESASAPSSTDGHETKGDASTEPATVAEDSSASSGVKPEARHAAGAAKSDASDDAFRALVARLVEPDGEGGWRTNQKAALELEKLGPDAEQRLWPLLSDPSDDVRRGAAVRLADQFNPDNAEQVSAFSDALEDSDSVVRGRAIGAFRKMNEADVMVAIPRLAKMLDAAREPDPNRRTEVARLLQGLKTDAAPAADELLNSVKTDPDPQVRGASLVALSHVAPADKVVAAASEALADKDAGVRLVAAARLRQLGKEAAPAAGALAETLADDDQRVREGAADALIRIGSPAVAAVGKMLDSPQVHARQLSLACAVRLAPASVELLPAIKKRLKDEDETVRKLAELAVAKLQM